MDKEHLEEQARAFCAEHGVQVRLFYEMPRGYEEAYGTYDRNSVFLNGSLLQNAPEEVVLFYLFHELRHALQHQHPERLFAVVRESLPYVVLYDGTCYRLTPDGEQVCHLDGGAEVFTDAYLGLPYEEDANAYAYARVCALCGETEELRRLREFWRPKRAWTAEEYRRLFRRIDRAVSKVEENRG